MKEQVRSFLESQSRVYEAQMELKHAKEALEEATADLAEVAPHKFTMDGYRFQRKDKTSTRVKKRSFYSKHPELVTMRPFIDKKAVLEAVNAGIEFDEKELEITTKPSFTTKADE